MGFLENVGRIFLGNSMILLDQCRIFLGICSIFKDLVK